jgi:SAM-dependent methyltransferase
MDVPREINHEQARLWNGPSGHAWVENQELLDHIYKPFEHLIVEIASAKPRDGVLDVGCGAGATTLAIARGVGGVNRCVGVDISEPLVAVARARAEREHIAATFICANAQTHPFEDQMFDLIVSRFGVMFFDDPVAAFGNLRRAARDRGELRAIAWRSAADNAFMTTAERTAAPLLPNLSPRRPNAPGQFALANDHRMHAILDASGWSNIDIRPIDVSCTMPAKDLVRYVTRLGPVGLVFQQLDETTRARVVETVLPALSPFVQGDEVRFTAACWLVAARRRD